MVPAKKLYLLWGALRTLFAFPIIVSPFHWPTGPLSHWPIMRLKLLHKNFNRSRWSPFPSMWRLNIPGRQIYTQSPVSASLLNNFDHQYFRKISAGHLYLEKSCFKGPLWDQKILIFGMVLFCFGSFKIYIVTYCPRGTSQLSIWVDFNTLQRGKINPKVYLELEVATDRRGRQRLPLFVFICFAFEILQWGLTFRLKVNPEVGGGLAIVGVCYCLYFNPSFLIAPCIHYLWLIHHFKWIWIFNRFNRAIKRTHGDVVILWYVISCVLGKCICFFVLIVCRMSCVSCF